MSKPQQANGLDKFIGYFAPGAMVRRVAARQFYSNYYEGAGAGQSRRYLPVRAQDMKVTASSGTRTDLLSHARYLTANLGIVRSAVGDFVRYSVGPHGLRPQAQSANGDWASEAEAYFAQWSKIADVSGRFTFGELQRMLVWCMVVDGDAALILSETDSGYPKVQMVEGHQIGNGPQDEGWYDGVRLSPLGSPSAYRIIDANGAQPKKLADIDAANFAHLFEAERASGVRGISWLSHFVANARDILELQGYEKHFLKNACSINLLETNESGSADVGASYLGGTSGGGDDGLSLEQMEAGQIRYFKGGTNSKLEAFQFDRPGEQFRNFLDYLESDGFVGLGLPANWKNMHKEGGATLRAALVKAQRRFEEVQALVSHRVCARVWGYVIAKAAKRGDISKLPADWYKVRWQAPAKPTVDIGREAQANRDDLKMGLRTYAEDYGERGLDWQESLRQTESEASEVLEAANRIAAKHGVSLDYAVQMIAKRDQFVAMPGVEPGEAPPPQNPQE